MTPAERRVWLAAERHAADIGPEMRAAVLRVFRELLASLTAAEMARLIAAGSVEALVQLVVSRMEAEATVAPVREAIRTAYARSARAGIRVLPLPKALTVDAVFDFLNPRVVDAITTLESRALGTLTAETAETVRQVVRRGIERGVGPRALIPELRGVIGLAPNQEAAVANFRAMLARGPTLSEVFPHRNAEGKLVGGRALRHKRYDDLLRRVIKDGTPLTPDQIEKMTDAYRKKFLAFNAETHARTAALNAARAGQRESWEAAIENGGLDRSRMTKRWITTMDGRQRPEHGDANGLTVGFDELFPVDGGVMVPGENAYNCFAADTVVEGAFVGGLEARYSGPMREIKTARGHRLCVTPNHPILTAQGWTPAHELREGVTLFSDTREPSRALTDARDVHNEHRPPSVKQVFDTIAAQGTSTARALARLDLHGDAQFVDGAVHVVRSHTDLLCEPFVPVADGANEWALDAPNVNQALHPRLGPPHLDLDRVGLPASSAMSGADLTGDGSGVALDPIPLQPLCFGAAAHWHTSLAEPSKQDDALVPAFVRELLEASAGAVSLDEIVEVRDFDAVVGSHVYDLQSVTGWILAGGIVSSNCRCVALYKYDLRRAA